MDYIISADRSWIDVDVVRRFLSEESYWAHSVPREIVAKSLSRSIPFSLAGSVVFGSGECPTEGLRRDETQGSPELLA